MIQKFNDPHVLLIGPGAIGLDYYKVLRNLGIKHISVVGRKDESTSTFYEKTGINPEVGLKDFLDSAKAKDIHAAIVCVSVEELSNCAINLIEKGVQHILLEKPAGADLAEIQRVHEAAKKADANVLIAYNRRFYSSVIELRHRLQEEGGVVSVHFEFNEWPHVILPKIKNPKVLNNWILANSSHVIDLSFHLAGKPKTWTSYVSQSLPWHKKAAIFAGSGITEQGAVFSYHSNWMSPGRWGIDVCTIEHRYILRPLEKLQVQKHRSVNIDAVNIDDALDTQFKPGLFLQVQSFLKFIPHPDMISIGEHFERAKEIYTPIMEPYLKA